MVILFQKKLKDSKTFIMNLKKIFGIGWNNSYKINNYFGFNKNKLIKNIKNWQLIKTFIEKNYIVDVKLKKFIYFNINKWKSSYKGFRRKQGLPLRGQKTHSNAKTTKRYRKKTLKR